MSYEYLYYEDKEETVPRIENIMIDTSGGKTTATVEFSVPPSLFSLLCGKWKRTRYSVMYWRVVKELQPYRLGPMEFVKWIDVRTGEDAKGLVEKRLENMMLLKKENYAQHGSISVQ